MAWDDRLTKEQSRAASHTDGHARLLAGPGTGKTLTVVARAEYLIGGGVPPRDIAILTFTRAAAAELKKRLRRQLGLAAELPRVSTLHSFALSTILANPANVRLPKPIRIADDFEERHVVQEDLKRILGLKKIKDVDDLLKLLASDWEADRLDPGFRLPHPEFMGAWGEHRQIYGYTLRSELVYRLKHALSEGGVPHLSGMQYVMVDEYQDLNPCDLSVIDLLVGEGASIYCAGDDDQSIYGFRNANPQAIRDFCSHFPGAADYGLTVCKRCPRVVLETAHYVAQQDPRRLRKRLEADPDVADGHVSVLTYPDERDEAEGVARLCNHLVAREDVAPEGILVLMRSDRNRSYSDPLREAISGARLPVRLVTDPMEPFNSEGYRGGRHFLSLLRLLVDERDSLAWRTALQVDNMHGVGTTRLASCYDLAREQGRTFSNILGNVEAEPGLLKDGAYISRAVTAIRADLDQMRSLFRRNSLRNFVQAAADQHVSDRDCREGILAALTGALDTSGSEELGALLTDVGTGLGDKEQERPAGAIALMTMHQAKGLDADAVFIVAAEEELIPGRHAGAGLDDERRLLYVSLTRARRFLFISHCRRRNGGRQRNTGSNPGSPYRHLTRFLSGGPVASRDGPAYVERVTTG